MARTSTSSPVTDLERAILYCRRRDYNLEGIPMYLMLEDLTLEQACRSAEGGRLGRLLANYLGRLVAERDQASLLDVATALEVLAAYHFDPEDDEAPVTSATTLGKLAAGPLVRTMNFHNTIRAQAVQVERQLMAAGERFSAIDENDLDGLLSGRAWHDRKPPLIPVFYEGYRNNYDIALPLLERVGLRGWFFIPTSFIDTPVPEQYAFARAHHIGLTDEDRVGGRCAMTWDELRDVVACGHVVACHTATHCAIVDVETQEDAQRELVDSRRRLEQELGREVRSLAWLFGAPYGEDGRVDTAVRESGYRLVFSNTKIQSIQGCRPRRRAPGG
jgi:peptidoglycan/xylan/chitin deacetylase (PgdA/CDA1 family)